MRARLVDYERSLRGSCRTREERKHRLADALRAGERERERRGEVEDALRAATAATDALRGGFPEIVELSERRRRLGRRAQGRRVRPGRRGRGAGGFAGERRRGRRCRRRRGTTRGGAARRDERDAGVARSTGCHERCCSPDDAERSDRGRPRRVAGPRRRRGRAVPGRARESTRRREISEGRRHVADGRARRGRANFRNGARLRGPRPVGKRCAAGAARRGRRRRAGGLGCGGCWTRSDS